MKQAAFSTADVKGASSQAGKIVDGGDFLWWIHNRSFKKIQWGGLQCLQSIQKILKNDLRRQGVDHALALCASGVGLVEIAGGTDGG